MDSFEFSQIPIAIVIGFAISEIFAGWGEQIRNRRAQPFSALQFVATLWILSFSVRYLWIQWWARSVDWGFGDYLLAIAPAGVIALSTHVARGGTSQDLTTDPYERDRRPLCLLLALVSVLMIARVTLSVRPDLLSAPIGINAVNAAAFLAMAGSADRRAQWAGWAVVWGSALIAVALLAGSLAD